MVILFLAKSSKITQIGENFISLQILPQNLHFQEGVENGDSNQYNHVESNGSGYHSMVCLFTVIPIFN